MFGHVLNVRRLFCGLQWVYNGFVPNIVEQILAKSLAATGFAMGSMGKITERLGRRSRLVTD